MNTHFVPSVNKITKGVQKLHSNNKTVKQKLHANNFQSNNKRAKQKLIKYIRSAIEQKIEKQNKGKTYFFQLREVRSSIKTIFSSCTSF